MKPYYDHDGIQIWLGDCREVLPTLNCSSVDLVLTDPPYGIKACDRSDGGVGSIASGSKFYGRQTWDYKLADSWVIDWIFQRNGSAIIWGGNYYSLPPSSCWLVWDKMQRDFSFADAEMAWTNLQKATRIFSYSRGQLTAEGKVHPTQKPVSLMAWCIGLSKTSGTILDPYSGSGSTLVAAKHSGRKAVGIEVCEAYAEIAANRLAQGTLFAPEPPPSAEQEPALFLGEM